MKIIICGCNGKMGKAVAEALKKNSDCKIVAGIDINSSLNFDFPVFTSLSVANVQADVIIDFSHPSLISGLLKYCEENHTPAVICTTGLNETQINDIQKTSKKAPIFYSRNMSLGINVISELSRKASEILGNDFDIEIIEKHHNQKIDAPSGTALMIAEEITQTKNEEFTYMYDRTPFRKARSKNEIGIHSVRGGSIPGDHEVIFAGKDEIITISHHAGSRDIFATGAVKAAKFIINQPNGLYTMKNIIDEI